MSAAGNNLEDLGTAEISLHVGELSSPIKVILVAETDPEVVLGLDFMKQYEVKIDLSQEMMTIQEQRVHLSCVGKIGWLNVVLTCGMTPEHRPMVNLMVQIEWNGVAVGPAQN